jgi:hypothetical protein
LAVTSSHVQADSVAPFGPTIAHFEVEIRKRVELRTNIEQWKPEQVARFGGG